MSRGLGVRQRQILAVLQEREAVYLAELPGSRTANHRAARRLLDAGLIDVWTHDHHYGDGNDPSALAVRKGYAVPNDYRVSLKKRWRQWVPGVVVTWRI